MRILSAVSDATEYNQEQLDKDRLTVDMVTALVEHWQETHDLEPDGKAGQMTRSSIESIVRSSAPAPLESFDWWSKAEKETKFWDGPEESQPANRKELYAMLGSPGQAGHPDKDWEKANIISCHQKLRNRLPGAPTGQWIQVNRRVEPYLREALRRAQLVCPDYKITKLGSHNFRHKRHNPNEALSMHSWGIAVDINPHLNFGRSFPRGKAPKAWSKEYLEVWPDGVPKGLVEAFKSCGFAWGSDWDEDGFTHDHTFLDPMHFEWIARDGNSIEV